MRSDQDYIMVHLLLLSFLISLVDVKTETHQDQEIWWMLRPRLIETGKFGGCRDRDSLRPGKSMGVETETNRDWAKDVETETLSRVSLISGPCMIKLVYQNVQEIP